VEQNDYNQKELKGKLNELYKLGVFTETSEERIKLLNELKKVTYDCTNDSYLESYKKLFKALGSKTRLSILKLILMGVKCSCEIEHLLNLSQSTVSHHLTLLAESKVIHLERTGKWTLASVPLGKEFSKAFFLELLDSVLD